MSSYLSCHWARFLFVAIFVAIVHVLLPTNAMVFWDDWLWTSATFEGDYESMFGIGLERGAPLDGYIIWLMTAPIGDLLGGQILDYGQAHKIVAYMMIILIAMLTYGAASSTGFMTPLGAMLVAAFSYAYPAYQTLVASSWNNAYLLMFMIAVNLYLTFIYKWRGAPERIWRYRGLVVLVLALFFVSFTFGALMFYFVAFLLIVYFMRLRDQHAAAGSFFSPVQIFTFCKIHAFYLLMPIAHWIVKETFFPRYGQYSSTYKTVLTWESIVERSIASFWENGVAYHFSNALHSLLDHQLLSAIVIIAVAFVYISKVSTKSNFLVNSDQVGVHSGLMLFGVLTIALTVLPYALIGQYMHFKGWWTRQGFLLCLPIAIFVVGAVELAFSRTPRLLQGLALGMTLVLLIIFSSARFNSYLDWQARAIKDEAIIHNLQSVAWKDDYSFFVIDDKYPMGGQATYADYEWSSIFKYGLGREAFYGQDKMYNRIGEALNSFRKMSIPLKDRYNITDINVEGCHAHLTILRGEEKPGRVELTLRYLYYKWRHADSLPGFFERLVDFEVKPLKSEYAKDCS